MTSVLYDNPGPKTRRRIRFWTAVSVVALAAIVGFAIWQVARKGQISADMWTPFADSGLWNQLFSALFSTIKAALLSIVLALVLGAVLAAGRLSNRGWLRWPAFVVIEFFRAVPLLLLILFGLFTWGQPLAFIGEAIGASPPDAFAALVVGLTLYNGSVLAEVFRAGINAVPRGQSEAAYALGMRKTAVMRMILAPQAIRMMLPAIVAQCVVALKDSALGFIVGYQELLSFGKRIYQGAAEIWQLSQPPVVTTLVVIGAIYIAINLVLSWFAGWLERRMSRSTKLAGKPLTAAQTGDEVAAADAVPAGVEPPN
ncbi:amino acid ABC transporter permease [Actinocatenispora rupis]|uniref:Amino acid ABC transporter permease n=1 Tax=Actinocatenispora rupis TaxID=519421 RepID=A0A8J3N7E9_9ACTN|nr:amino acid ABC transporter permease [Actinocatenispora rupis]GID09244.1 amino acid ABC transporter permease [Actinocatenispora rupis]